MVSYSTIRFWRDDDAKERAIDRLLELRGALFTDIKNKRDEGAFLLATWNIRDFDSNKFGHGRRLDESYLYLAEIISTFDLVALQEVDRDIRPLKRLVQLLGPDWAYIATDTAEGVSGNRERMAFVYNTTTISFGNRAGEVVLPREKDRQFARTPFVAAFQAGWFKFNLCTAHIYFGAESGAKKARRVAEIKALTKFFADRQKRESEDYIILGDFNVTRKSDATMKALTSNGFSLPPGLVGKASNLKGDKLYDQVALRVRNKMLEIGDSGVFDFEKYVFRSADFDAYEQFLPAGQIEGMTKKQRRAYYLKWRTWQISDHKPMWVELKVDFTRDYLESLRPEQEPLADLDAN